jgi:N-methylhydantoinase B
MERDADQAQRDVALGYYTPEEAGEKFGVVLSGSEFAVDRKATDRRRAG